MRVIIQRVTASQVKVKGKVVGEIGKGLNLLVGIAANDTVKEIDWMVRKCLDLRLFPADSNGDNKSAFADSTLGCVGNLCLYS